MKSHILLFFSCLFLFYSPIFLRIEAWPFTDWGLFTNYQKLKNSIVYKMELRSINTKKVLNLSPALVNKVIKTTLSNSKRKIITKKDTSFFNFLRIKILESGQQLEQEAYQIKIFKIIPNISEQKIKINKELFFNETINFNI